MGQASVLAERSPQESQPFPDVREIFDRLQEAIALLLTEPNRSNASGLCLTSREILFRCVSEEVELDSGECVELIAMHESARKAMQRAADLTKDRPDDEGLIIGHLGCLTRRGYMLAEHFVGRNRAPRRPVIPRDPGSPYVFISYVRENEKAAKRLQGELASRGIHVWLDRHDIKPVDRWKPTIAHAIHHSQHFLALFSTESSRRAKSYMNVELRLAIDELRQRPWGSKWLIPVRLADCAVPDIPIGAGESLPDIQYIDLWSDWTRGIEQIASIFQGNRTS